MSKPCERGVVTHSTPSTCWKQATCITRTSYKVMRHYEYVSGVQILLRASGIPAFIHSFIHSLCIDSNKIRIFVRCLLRPIELMGSFTYFLRSVRSQAKERKERRKKTRRRSRKNKKKHWVKKKRRWRRRRRRNRKRLHQLHYEFGILAHITECRVQHRTISL